MRDFVTRNAMLVLAALALLLSVLVPPRVMPASHYRFMVTFDISQSMNVADVTLDGRPATRHAMARRAVGELLGQLACGSEIGFAVFTQRRVLPLVRPVEVCDHYQGLLTALELIDGNMRWANASGVGRGLHQSIRAAHEFDGDIMVLFLTDGHEAPPLRPDAPPMPSVEQYAGIGGLIVGIGAQELVRIPKLDPLGNVIGYWGADEVVQSWNEASGEGNEELSSRKDAHLRTLAEFSGLDYAPLDATEDLARLALVPRFASVGEAPVDWSWLPASLALLLLAMRFTPARLAMTRRARARRAAVRLHP